MDDIRYSELVFLRALASGSQQFEYFSNSSPDQLKAVGLPPGVYLEMTAALIEDLCVRFDNPGLQMLVTRLRQELFGKHNPPHGVIDYHWEHPREGIVQALSPSSPPRLRITYRGLRRIEELRDVLARDRVLEDFGVLLSIRYVRKDLEDALRRGSDTPVSLVYADMDNFKAVNEGFGHDGGDVVMKKYLEVVRDALGNFGRGYRGSGDEVVALVVGQGHERAVEFAQNIRRGVGDMVCEYKGQRLPKVTSSIGVATTPPESRSIDLQNIADARQQKAKNAGKNRVVAS